MKNKYLIFDLDDVLFNTGFLIKSAVKQNIKTEDRIGVFDMEMAKKINWQKIKPLDLIYEGVKEMLFFWQKKRYQLFLFSEGNIRGQLYKIKISQLDKFFPQNKRFIFNKDKEKKFTQVLNEIPSQSEIWYFDDKPNKLRHIKKLNDKIKTVLVCQGLWWQTKVDNFKPDYKVKNLQELEGIL